MRIINIALLFLVFIFASFNTNAQLSKKEKSELNDYLEIADRYYQKEQFYKATEYYKRALNIKQDNAEVTYKLARSYQQSLNYKKAMRFFQKSINYGTENKKARFWLAKMQKLNGKHKNAKKNFKKFIKDYTPKSEDEKDYISWAKLLRDGCTLAIKAKGKPIRNYKFHLVPEPVNTKNLEYAPHIYKNDSTIVFTSTRKVSERAETSGRFGDAYSDNYRYTKEGDKWVETEYNDDFNELNTKYNDAGGVFTKNYKKFYFTTCSNPGGGCEIMVSKMENGKWKEPEALNKNINPDGVWNSQPAISPSGDTLFFSSKRDGGYGKHDIWMSVKKEQGEENWGKAKNLGKNVNTPFREMTPSYYPKENILFFSSDGHESFGGFDVFMARGSNFDTVINAGKPFNSSRDDIYFVLGRKTGYMTSNRTGGIGKDDIYKFSIESQEAVITTIEKDSLSKAKSITIEGNLLHKNGEPAVDVPVYLTNKAGKELKVSRTNKEGLFRFDNLPADKSYRITIKEKEKRTKDKAQARKGADKNKAQKEDKDKDKNESPGKDKEEQTDITKENQYKTKNVTVKKSKKSPTRVLFENVYFDFNSAEIRPEGKQVLKDIAEYIKDNPDSQIELRANTDSIGPNQYNVTLSQKRGEACYNFLKKSGVDPENLVINPQGEKNPMATNNNPIGRQLNRRVEFYIVDGGEKYLTPYMTHIIEPKMTLYSLSQRYNMKIEKIKEINDLDTNNIEAFRPIRVKRTSASDSAISPQTRKYLQDFPDKWKNYWKKMNTTGGVDSSGDQARFHTVKPQQTLYIIAKKYGTTVKKLKEANNLQSNKLSIGQKLKIP